MMKQTEKRITSLVMLVTILRLLLCSFAMINFYKTLSGFIANRFEKAHVMLPIVSTYLLPVLCFLFVFYDFYVKRSNRVARYIASGLTMLLAIFNLVGIFSSFGVFSSGVVFSFSFKYLSLL